VAGYQHTSKTRQRIARGVRRSLDRRRALARIGPAELRELEQTGSVSPGLRPYVAQALDEVCALTQALGGEEHVSEQKALIVRDVARLGALLAGLTARALQREQLDLDEVARINALAGTRGRLLSVLGVERVAAPVPDLAAYLAAREAESAEDRATGAIAGAQEPEVVIEGASGADADAEREAGL
jgi:hypothetical protein